MNVEQDVLESSEQGQRSAAPLHRSRCRGPRIALVLLLGLLGTASVVQAQAVVQATPSSGARWMVFDEVTAMVGDEIIALSSFRQDYQRVLREQLAELRKKNPLAKISGTEKRHLRNQFIRDRFKQIILAENAKTLGKSSEEIERRVQAYVDFLIKREKDRAGSTTAFFKRLEERGISYREFEQEQRTLAMTQLVLQNEIYKFQERKYLKVTPKEMLRYYKANQKEFSESRSATGVGLRFAAPSGTAVDASTRKKLLAKALATRDRLAKSKDAEAMAKSLGVEFLRFELRPGESSRKEILDFFLQEGGKDGAVSQPIEIDSAFWVLRRDKQTPAKTRRFTDRKVQEHILTVLIERRTRALDRELMFRLLRNASVSPSEITQK